MKFNTNGKNLAGGIVPNIYINNIELDITADNQRNKSRNPHISDGRRSTNYNAKTSNNSLDTAMKATLNMSIKLPSIGFLTERTQDLKYLKVMIVQCLSKNVHDKISGNSFDYFISLLNAGSERDLEAGSIKTVILSVDQFMTSVYNQSSGRDLSGRREIQDNESDLPYVLSSTIDSDSFYNIPLKANFFIGEDQGGTKASFLSYFAFSFYDKQQRGIDTYRKLIPSRLTNFLSIGKISSEIVINSGKTVANSYAFKEENGKYWNGPVHQMRDGRWMKHSSHTNRENQNTILQFLSVPNIKLRDHRIYNQLANLNFDLLGNERYTTQDQRLIDQLRRDSNLDLIKKKPNIFSDFYITRDRTNSARFMFSANMEEYVKHATDFPKIIDNLKNNDSVGYQNIIDSARIADISIKRYRVKSTERLTSRSERTDVITNEETVIIANSADSDRGLVSKIRTNSERDPKNKNLRPRTYGLIEEVSIATQNISTGVRHFTGTDFDIANNRDGEYQYVVDMEVIDPVIPFLKGNLDKLRRAIQGDSVSPGFEQYYQDSLERKSYYDSLVGQFNLTFLEFYNKKYNNNVDENPQSNNFVFRNVNFLTKLYYQLSSELRNKGITQVSVANYLTNISSPNSGSPEGIRKVLELMYSLEKSLSQLIQKNTRFVKYRGDTSSEANATDPSMQGSRSDRKTKISYVFENKFNAKTNPKIGYDFLFSRKSETEANTDGLTLFTKSQMLNRFSLETSKYFKANSSSVIIEDRDGSIYNTGDRLDNTKYSFLSVSNIFLKQEDKDVVFSNINGTTKTNSAEELNNILTQVSVINKNKDLFYGSKTREEVDRTEQNVLEGLSLTNKLTINENRAVRRSNGRTSKNMIFSDNAQRDSVDRDENLFNEEQRNRNNRPLPVGTKDLMISLDQISNNRFLSENNSIKFYFVNDREGALTFKKQLENKEDRTTTARTESRIPDLNSAPNHIKALMLSLVRSDSVNPDRMFDNVGDYVDTSKDSLRDPANAGSVFFNYKNLRKVEVFRGYETRSNTASIKKPIWSVMTKQDLDNISAGNVVLCRHMEYTNNAYGIERNENLQLPTYNDYFFISESVADTNGTSSRGEFILKNTITTNRTDYRAPNDLQQKLVDLFNSRALMTEPNINHQNQTIRPEFMNSNIVVKNINLTSLGFKGDNQEKEILQRQKTSRNKELLVLANEVKDAGLEKLLPKGFNKQAFNITQKVKNSTNKTNNTNGTSNY